MTEVLPVPLPVDTTSYLSTGQLRRSASSKAPFYATSPSSYGQTLQQGHHVHIENSYPPAAAPAAPAAHHHRHQLPSRISTSLPSSAASSPPILSHHGSSRSSPSTSTPVSCLSLNTKFAALDAVEDGRSVDAADDPIIFPSYEDVGFGSPTPEPADDDDDDDDDDDNHDNQGDHYKDDVNVGTRAQSRLPPAPPPTSPCIDTPDFSVLIPRPQPTTKVEPSKARTSSDSRLPEFIVTAEDDIALSVEPSRHVDYLSHDWVEEDVWVSWRHIVTRRKYYGNSVRLENSSWRAWGKMKYRLRTVAPHTLNWLKDYDVTWLYGPLQTRRTRTLMPCDTPAGSRLSQTNSFLAKKPILKKRSMSEIMLQRSLSASSLLKQAAAAVEAQRRGGLSLPGSRVQRRNVGRGATDFVAARFASSWTSTAATTSTIATSTTTTITTAGGDASSSSSSADPSTSSSSGLMTPGVGERRHIHFNNEVEQCIAVEIRDEYDDDTDGNARATNEEVDDDESDGDVVMMRASSTKASSKVKISRRNTPRTSLSAESKTIAMLPSTTLKFRDEMPELDEFGSALSPRPWNTRRPSPSPSLETLRPSRPSTNLFLGGDHCDDDDENDPDEDMSWEPAGAFIPGTEAEPFAAVSSSHENGVGEPYGLRRTASGMFMPDQDDEDEVVSTGLFGRVVDTVNTARDIAHVIWNVGWRR